MAQSRQPSIPPAPAATPTSRPRGTPNDSFLVLFVRPMDILECIHRSATGETHETDPVDPNLSILWDESKTRVLGFRLNGLGEWFQNMDPSLLSDIRARNLDDIVELVRGQMAAEHAVDRWYRFFKGWVPGVSVPDTIWDNMLGH